MVSAMTARSKHGYQYLKSVTLRPYKHNHRNFFFAVAVLLLVSFAYVSWNCGTYRNYKEFYRPIPREAYYEPRLFEYGVGQHDVRQSYKRFADTREISSPSTGPTMASYWRSVQTVRDFRNFLRAALRGNFSPTSTLAMSRRFLRTMENDLNRMIFPGILQKSTEILESLKRKILAKISDLQNPPTCHNVINCKMTTESGMSSGLHDVLYCLMLGLQKNKTVALDTSKWHHFADTPWNYTFLNLGSCPTAVGAEDVDLKNEYRKSMNYLPSNFANIITDNHGDPYAWWYGILMSYILRPNAEMEVALDEYLREQTNGSPYVAIHIRRTDKAGEASFRPLEAYVAEAEEYFARLSLKEEVREKLVYVATDDPGVLNDLDEKFRSFKFFSNEDIAWEAYSYSRRRKTSAVAGIMKDYHMISHAEHIVCTLSSGFCRLAYELMNSIRNDAWSRISSLDNDFYYAYVLQHERQAVEPYEDGVYTSEIRDTYRSDAPESFQQMISLTLTKSYSPIGADGFVYSNDVRRTVAKFKTSLTYPSMSYNSSISQIVV